VARRAVAISQRRAGGQAAKYVVSATLTNPACNNSTVLKGDVRLKIIPVALGAGERLFGETSDKNLCASSTLRLRGCSGGAPAARLLHRSQLLWARIRLE
jgi:hypothetical protein